MDENSEPNIYPHTKNDRRLFPNLPSRAAERRDSEQRFVAGFPLRLLAMDNDAELLTGTGLDISQTGARIIYANKASLLHVGQFVSVRGDLPAGALPEGFEENLMITAQVVRIDENAKTVALKFQQSLAELYRHQRWFNLQVAAIFFLFLVFAGLAYVKYESVIYFVFNVPVYLYGIGASLFLVSRFFFALFYRPIAIQPSYTPSVTIIVPCFNEEEWISETVRCCLNQDYPEEQLRVIVVDDGSSDKSVEKVREFYDRAIHELPNLAERLQILVQERNQGKREAMARGTRLATTELVIFVDSDSMLEPNAVRELVQPLRYPKISAVAGRTEVKNKWTNALTKMQTVRYYIAFRIFKAAESIFDTVTCLSGPLACYRRELVLQHLDAWLKQRFMGMKATLGDDRSMTNFILEKNRTVYQDTAVCSTMVPTKMRQFLRQQMRWKRSWLRESLRAGKFFWRKEPFSALSFYVGLLLPIISPLIVLRALIYIPFTEDTFPAIFLLGILIMSLLMSSTYLLLRRSNLWWYGTIFCAFYLGVLLWQIIPAMFTFWKSEWGTRPTVNDIKKNASGA